MNIRYVAVVDAACRLPAELINQIEASVRELGMRCQLASPNLTLFVDDDAPIVTLPGLGTIIGHLFDRNGSRVERADQLPCFSDPRQLRAHLVANCWGPYLLLQSPDEHGGITVLREPSPSGDVACVYALKHGNGFITSDIALAERLGLFRRRIDWDAIRHRLLYPQLKSADTALHGIKELLPGTLLHLRPGRTTVAQAWSPWDFVAPGHRHADPRVAAEDVRAAVTTSVRTLARIDQRILLELSGGLDSSIVGMCLDGAAARIACASLVTTVPGADERHYARMVANQLEAELHIEMLSLDETAFDFPLIAHTHTPRIGVLQHAVDNAMSGRLNREGMQGFLSGGGGDTVFCALATAAPAADACRERGVVAGMTAVQDLALLHQCTFWKAARLTLRKLRRPPGMSHMADTSFLSPHVSAIANDHPWNDAPTDALPGDRERIRGLATCQAYRDSLERGMQHPMRMPLLSQPVVEACLRAPSWMWIAGGRNRAVARTAFADVLPADILNRRSKGTFMSYLGAVYQRNREQMCDYLAHGRLQEQGLLDTAALQQAMRHDMLQRGHTFTRVFDLCMVENWVRHQP